jgi:beta-galactosidase
MVHIYGHTWPIRWGKSGEPKELWAYSNCDEAEMFLNGKSLGTRKRNSQDFPAAGLRWTTPLADGTNKVRVVAHKGPAAVTDEIEFVYQAQSWGKPAEVRLQQTSHTGRTALIEATLHDAAGLRCLDSRDLVRFSLAGEGRLIDNLGTTHGSRELQFYNGRAEISAEFRGPCTVAASSGAARPAFLKIS